MIEIISPHIDDAAFSLGCYIKGIPDPDALRITTCFSKSNYHVGTEQHFNTDQVTTMRKREDEMFRQAIGHGVQFHYLDLLDAPLRGYEKCSFKSHFTEADELQIASLSKYYNERPASKFILPLALGAHVDHVIAIQSARKLSRHQVAGFYEDLPYAGRIPDEEITDRVKEVESTFGIKLRPVRVGECDTREKERLCSVYASQLKDWYLEKILYHFERYQGAERLWITDVMRDPIYPE